MNLLALFFPPKESIREQIERENLRRLRANMVRPMATSHDGHLQGPVLR
jgi:hypothetical protein